MSVTLTYIVQFLPIVLALADMEKELMNFRYSVDAAVIRLIT